MTAILETTWLSVCPLDVLPSEHGVAALLPDGSQVAVFRTHDDRLFALDNVDPRSGAGVLARGIVGDRAGDPVVSSPMHKQVYCLATGRCLDDPVVSVRTHPVRVVAGTIQVGCP
ncbi:nitrite reductase small subunit NirD [Actinoalloteichus hymeniacidonis]|uniref:NAD(P)H-dependent nitrite reductase, small subunit n=1 Tax=Actinoalloteichus hymeniacidonis TaxID=340345 RepID=A0AAC9HNJ3_9PSEU|nr:nitrite reductase small subunit NirD [Actinoalloteichus hymeniacidonis]AOS62667.1 NAD(P)H-dependent nitrite reductase, small subunit [Actinoalloteichus hymeniacidonis]MBB5909302.1 nitrite reductase (NADH) small subunit [Actinoalloteichus hymeniacidonis]